MYIILLFPQQCVIPPAGRGPRARGRRPLVTLDTSQGGITLASRLQPGLPPDPTGAAVPDGN